MDMMLSEDLRVLEIGDNKAYFGGKILTDLGATVVKVEPPGGDAARDYPPFYQGKPDRERSLYWWYMNGGKKGITLDLTKRRGQELCKKLVEKSDILLESYAPGTLDKWGLGYEALNRLNPKLIMVSITHFGQTGPYRDLKGSDSVCLALSGVMDTIGESDREPLPQVLEQAYNFGGIQATLAALACLYWRNQTGEGQWADISIFDMMVRNNYRPPVFWEFTKTVIKRDGVYSGYGGPRVRGIHHVKDGYVCAGGGFSGGPVLIGDSRAVYEWMKSEGYTGVIDEIDWQGDWAKEDWRQRTPEEKILAYHQSVHDFLVTRSKWDIDQAAEKFRFIKCPLLTVGDAVKHPQFKARGYWKDVEHEDIGQSFTYPGHYFLCSETENGIRFRAPHLGEHNKEIYQRELGLSDSQMAALARAKVI